MAKTKPNLSFWQMWNLSFGFLGVQMGYALQNANTSRIFQSLGADIDTLSYFWLAAPIAGLIVQPIIGMFSDHTWCRLGRRIPFILGGAILAFLAMLFMPNAELVIYLMSPLLFAGAMLLFMDMAFNVTMQPFRSLVSDMLNDKQKTTGYSIQSFLINCGAVIGSVLPFVLVNWFGLSNISTPEAQVPQSVSWAYYIGGGLLILTVIWTAIRTREYPPKEFNEYNKIEEKDEKEERPNFWQLLRTTPKVMLQLGVVQFFTWAALFILWTYSTPSIAQSVWGVTNPRSLLYQEAGDWVGVMFGAYAAFAGLFSIIIPRLSARWGNKPIYSLSLICGALGYFGMAMIESKWGLMLPMLGIGIAWGAILALPYSILAKSLPAQSTGLYMGIFNFTITIPQIFVGLIGGMVIKYAFGGNPVSMIITAGVLMILAALSVGLVQERNIGSEEIS